MISQCFILHSYSFKLSLHWLELEPGVKLQNYVAERLSNLIGQQILYIEQQSLILCGLTSPIVCM